VIRQNRGIFPFFVVESEELICQVLSYSGMRIHPNQRDDFIDNT